MDLVSASNYQGRCSNTLHQITDIDAQAKLDPPLCVRRRRLLQKISDVFMSESRKERWADCKRHDVAVA